MNTFTWYRLGWFFAPAVRSQKRAFVFSLSALLITVCAAHFASLSQPIFPVDDAYITLHNAKVLCSGVDDNFSGVPPIAGATSPIHLVLVTILLTVFEPEWALLAASWIGVILYLLGLTRLTWAHRGSLTQAALVVATGLTTGLTIHQLFNGMETGLAMAGLVWALVLASEDRDGAWWLRPFVYGLLPFLRPELIVITILLLAIEIPRQGRSHSPTRALLVAAISLLCFMPWIAWFWASSGALYPATIQAKKLFFAEGCLPSRLKMDWVFGNLTRFATTLGTLSIGMLYLPRRPLGRIGIAFVAVFVAAYYINFPGALGHYEQRYLYLFVPLLLYGLVASFQDSSRPWRVSASLLLVFATAEGAWRLPRDWETATQNRRFTEVELAGVAEWCSTNLPANATLLIHDAGYISHATDFNLVDFVGLKTPSSVNYHRRLTWPTCGRKRTLAIHEIASGHRPGYLVMLEGWDRIYKVTRGLKERGWHLTSLRHGSERTEPAYKVYRLEPP